MRIKEIMPEGICLLRMRHEGSAESWFSQPLERWTQQHSEKCRDWGRFLGDVPGGPGGQRKEGPPAGVGRWEGKGDMGKKEKAKEAQKENVKRLWNECISVQAFWFWNKQFNRGQWPSQNLSSVTGENVKQASLNRDQYCGLQATPQVLLAGPLEIKFLWVSIHLQPIAGPRVLHKASGRQVIRHSRPMGGCADALVWKGLATFLRLFHPEELQQSDCVDFSYAISPFFGC